jgi:hypothetical protein
MRDLPVVLLCRTAQALLKNGNSAMFRHIPPRHEGRYGQSSRNVGRDAMDARVSQDEWSRRGRRNRVVPAPRRWCQVRW